MDEKHLAQMRRLEQAQARQNERLQRAVGAESLPVGGGFAHMRGPGHPLNQALGLVDPVSAEDLAQIEAFLGAPTVLELSPAADPALWPLLAARGYRVRQFQHLLTRPLPPQSADPLPAPALPPGVEIREADPAEEWTYNCLIVAGFFNRSEWRNSVPPFRTPLGVPDIRAFFIVVDREPVGGGMLGLIDGAALLSGDAILPPSRGRGLQKLLIAHRLAVAQAAGCDIACASTEPSTASQRSLESCGFRVAWPKLEMARG